MNHLIEDFRSAISHGGCCGAADVTDPPEATGYAVPSSSRERFASGSACSPIVTPGASSIASSAAFVLSLVSSSAFPSCSPCSGFEELPVIPAAAPPHPSVPTGAPSAYSGRSASTAAAYISRTRATKYASRTAIAGGRVNEIEIDETTCFLPRSSGMAASTTDFGPKLLTTVPSIVSPLDIPNVRAFTGIVSVTRLLWIAS